MAWTVKLQSGNGGVSGYNEFELVYDAASQANYKLQYNSQIGGQDADVLYHTPDNGSPIPKRLSDKNALIFLTMDVTGDDWDDIINRIDKIKRLVSGAESQAARYSTGGNAERVRVKIQPDGATLATYYDVLHGFVDATKAYYSPEATINTLARQVVVGLTCKPGGYGDAITLKNMLSSSPHMVEDSNGDGLADGLALIGSPSKNIETNNYVIGGKSQRITAASANLGFSTTAISGGSATEAAGFVIIGVVTGNVSIQIWDGTAAAGTYIINATDSNDVSDRSYKTQSGFTFWRVPFSVSFSTSSNISVRIFSSGAAATFLVDAIYLQLSTSTVPIPFASTYSLKNRYDPDVATANINYLDVWGVPGDMPAHVNVKSEQDYRTGTLHNGLIISSISDGELSAENYLHTIENDYFDSKTGTYSTQTDATRTGGNYLRWTTSGTAEFGIAGASLWLNHYEWTRIIPIRVYAIVRTSNAANKISYSWSGTNSGSNDAASVNAPNTWEVVDLGLMNAMQTEGLIIPKLTITISSGTFDFDALLLMPVSENLMIIPQQAFSTSGYTIEIDGERGIVLGDVNVGSSITIPSQVAVSSYSGSFWTVACGNKMTRIIQTLMSDYSAPNTQLIDISTEHLVTLAVTPRTSHLLGTQ